MRTEPTAAPGFDSRSLDALRQQAGRDPRAAARGAAVQFETMFTQMVLKSMRDATPKAEGASPGVDTFTSMLDAQFAKQLAGRPQGLADVLEKQLTRHMQNLPPVSPENQPAAAPELPAFTPSTSLPRSSAAVPVSAYGGAPVTAASGKVAGLGGRAAAFIEKMLPHAQEAERQTGVPASFILGQAALESGWGKGEVKNADGSTSFNLFGIKATRGWKGGTTDVMTTEYVDGQPVRMRAGFRSYGSYSEAFADYARMLSGHPRYGDVVRGSRTAEAFAGGMQRAGYATDPNYATKLARTIHTLQRAMG